MAGQGGSPPLPTAALVRIYSRRTCGLCDEARERLEHERQHLFFELEEVFIDGNPSMEARYGERVPVVEVDGKEEFEIAVDPARFRRLISNRR